MILPPKFFKFSLELFDYSFLTHHYPKVSPRKSLEGKAKVIYNAHPHNGANYNAKQTIVPTLKK